MPSVVRFSSGARSLLAFENSFAKYASEPLPTVRLLSKLGHDAIARTAPVLTSMMISAPRAAFGIGPSSGPPRSRAMAMPLRSAFSAACCRSRSIVSRTSRPGTGAGTSVARPCGLPCASTVTFSVPSRPRSQRS